MEVMEWIMVNRKEYLLKLTFTWEKKTGPSLCCQKKILLAPRKLIYISELYS